MPRTVSIAACQFVVRPVGSFDEFAAHARGLLDRAAGADLVLFPELFTIELFTTFPDWMDLPVSELTRIHQYGNTSYTEDYRRLFESEARERGAAHRRRLPSGEEERQVSQRRLSLRPRRTGSLPRQDAHLPGRSRVVDGGGRHHRDGRAPLRQGGLQRVLRSRDSGVRCEPCRAGRRDHPVPVAHLHGGGFLARPPLCPGARDREPGVRRPLRGERRAAARRAAALPLGAELDSEPLRHAVGCAQRRPSRNRRSPTSRPWCRARSTSTGSTRTARTAPRPPSVTAAGARISTGRGPATSTLEHERNRPRLC